MTADGMECHISLSLFLSLSYEGIWNGMSFFSGQQMFIQCHLSTWLFGLSLSKARLDFVFGHS